MTDPTYETKESRRVDAIYEQEWSKADRDLRNGTMSVAQELFNNDELNDRFSALMRDHYLRELPPEALAARLSILLCDLVAEVAEWAAERKLSE